MMDKGQITGYVGVALDPLCSRTWCCKRDILAGICIIVRLLIMTNSPLAVDTNTWNVMRLVTASNQLTINTKGGLIVSWLLVNGQFMH